MKARVYPFLWYAKDADQAAAFYASIATVFAGRSSRHR